MSTDESRITERLATIYALRVPKDIIASTFTDHPRLPVLPSRASFRDYIYFRTEQRAQMLRERRSLLRRILAVAAFSISALVLIEIGSPLSRPAQVRLPSLTLQLKLQPPSLTLQLKLQPPSQTLQHKLQLPSLTLQLKLRRPCRTNQLRPADC